MRAFYFALLLGALAAPGCKSMTTSGRGGRLYLPEDEPLTTQRIEELIPYGMPIEQARRRMESYGFQCTYGDALGIEYLYCLQVKQKPIWPFLGTWSATIYHNGYVQRVAGRYELKIWDHGTRIPQRPAPATVGGPTPPPEGPPPPMVGKKAKKSVVTR